MKKNIFAGALGMAVLLLSACGGENREDIVLEKEAIPTAVSIQSQEQAPDADTSATEGQILNQSFTTELDGFGRVIFAPFVPVDYPSENADYGTTMFGDVRFMLLSPSDGRKIYDFPGEMEDNILIGFNRFTQVLSVAFRDYNNDGRTDILLLLEYEDSSGHVFRKARAYTQNEGEKEFRIDRGLSEYLGDYTENMDRIYEGIQAYENIFADILGEFSIWDIERFARKVRRQILEGDYESLAGECSYPIQIDGEMYINKEELLAAGTLEDFPQAFVDVIREETCEDMFHNWQGFMLGNGEVWISEVLNEDLSSAGIKIIGFNNIGKGPEMTEAGNSPVQTGTPQADPAREAYGSVLDKLYQTYALPDGTNLGYNEIYDLSENQFAVYDIDQDGKEELIIIWTTTYTAGMSEIVYGYDSASGTVRTELFEYPMLTFYDNGVVEAGLSHNHGLAGDMDFWPYILYRYDGNTDTYAVIAEVDAWNRAFFEKDYNDRAFPDDLDDDGDGILYKIMTGDREELMNLDEYEGWRDSVIGSANTAEIPFVKMTAENVQRRGGS